MRENIMIKTVYEILPTSTNGRNSEGCFFTGVSGEILFAYSRYASGKTGDDDACDIALIRSTDNGESWSECEIIARASDFGVKNIMCASALPLSDGRLCVYFLIKENDWTTSIGRTISSDGVNFVPERCRCDFPKAYYVIENDRFVRLSDGRVATVAATFPGHDIGEIMPFVSDDDGESFHHTGAYVKLSGTFGVSRGLEEPGIVELDNGLIWLYMRTNLMYQYQSYSIDGMRSFTPPEPSVFTSPTAPMSIRRFSDSSLIAAYNPIPNYNGRFELTGDMSVNVEQSGRTPLVLRVSKDNGRTWGKPIAIETEKAADFCYPSLYRTSDGAILCSYLYTRGSMIYGSYEKISMRITKITGLL